MLALEVTARLTLTAERGEGTPHLTIHHRVLYKYVLALTPALLRAGPKTLARVQDKPYEYVTVDSPHLASVSEDGRAFAEHLASEEGAALTRTSEEDYLLLCRSFFSSDFCMCVLVLESWLSLELGWGYHGWGLGRAVNRLEFEGRCLLRSHAFSFLPQEALRCRCWCTVLHHNSSQRSTW